ncbi:MAG TPA: glutathione S-transferase family protein [Kofleriaceae bacterium]|nr:glutathione S-transferase family protein [Kofleriaceae bacterium]
MSELVLFVGNKNYSSWSLRPYLALAHTGAKFRTETILLDLPESRGNILAKNPAGKVPVLYDGDFAIWDSLAICEYLAETYPAAKLWPSDRLARARARSISAEMHSGFPALRAAMPMNLRARKPGVGHTPDALADAARIQHIWHEALKASGGPFLFGSFSIADAMFAPVTTRFTTYGVSLDSQCAAYVDAVAGLPAFKTWLADAEREEAKQAKYDNL